MNEEIERLVIGVRADTSAFAQDVRTMRAELDGPLGASADRAGAALEHALGRAVRSGKVGFEDLKRYALGAMSEIAAGALRSAVGGGGLGRVATSLVGGLLGLPGRATGGPVSPGRAYMVGERRPEMFVPTSSGRVEASASGGAREVRVSISVNAPSGGEPRALAQSGRQVAREVKRALMRVD